MSRAFQAEKMNYELLGMGDAHLHWHLFPRRAGDIGRYGSGGRGPVWWYPLEKMYSDENRPSASELAEMKRKRYRRALDSYDGFRSTVPKWYIETKKAWRYGQ